ncbi:MAG: hypothetical protein RLZZ74_2266 [Cyanobacteriota bacterium]
MLLVLLFAVSVLASSSVFAGVVSVGFSGSRSPSGGAAAALSALPLGGLVLVARLLPVALLAACCLWLLVLAGCWWLCLLLLFALWLSASFLVWCVLVARWWAWFCWLLVAWCCCSCSRAVVFVLVLFRRCFLYLRGDRQSRYFLPVFNYSSFNRCFHAGWQSESHFLVTRLIPIKLLFKTIFSYFWVSPWSTFGHNFKFKCLYILARRTHKYNLSNARRSYYISMYLVSRSYYNKD